MSAVEEPKTAARTRPILTRYDDSPDAARGMDGSLSWQLAEHAGRPVLIVPPPR